MTLVTFLIIYLTIDDLKRVKAQLEMVHNSHPLKSSALNIVNYILSKTPPVHPVSSVSSIEFNEPCSQSELFEDLKDHTGFRGQLTGDSNDQWSFVDFVKGWGAMADYADPLKPDHNPLVALNVISESPFGFKKCIGGLPDELAQEGIFCKAGDNGSPLLYGIVTPASSISPPHVNNSGSGRIILQTYKTRLLIWWDVTDENLEKYESLHCRNVIGDPTLMALQTWGEFHWAILKPGEYIRMEPGQIHAAISSVNSAVSGWNFVSFTWVESGALKRIMSWEMELIKRRVNYISRTGITDAHLSDAVQSIEADLKLWDN
jgi:hypothetical protein